MNSEVKEHEDALDVKSPEEAEAERDARLAETVPENRRRRRADLPLDHEALLVGNTLSYRLAYWPRSVVFWHGRKVSVNSEEVRHLARHAVTWRTEEDVDLGRVKRPVPMFEFFRRGTDERVSEGLPEPSYPDAVASDPFDAAVQSRRDRKVRAVARARSAAQA